MKRTIIGLILIALLVVGVVQGWKYYLIVLASKQGVVVEQSIFDAGENDAADAFRHAYTSALVTYITHEQIALVTGNMVEWFGDTVNNQQPTTRAMDLHNNAMGREIGNHATHLGRLAKEVANAIHNGKAILSPAEVGNIKGTGWEKGKLQYLAPYIGTYQYDAVLNDSYVKHELTAMLGKDNALRLKRNLLARAPIGLDASCLVLKGNMMHRGDAEWGIVNVCIYSGDVHAAIFSKPNIMLFSNADRYDYLPDNLRQWLEHAATQSDLLKLPKSVAWEKKVYDDFQPDEDEISLKEKVTSHSTDSYEELHRVAPLLAEEYKDEFTEVAKLNEEEAHFKTGYKTLLSVDYASVDLNEDGEQEYISAIRSSYYCGATGDCACRIHQVESGKLLPIKAEPFGCHFSDTYLSKREDKGFHRIVLDYGLLHEVYAWDGARYVLMNAY